MCTSALALLRGKRPGGLIQQLDCPKAHQLSNTNVKSLLVFVLKETQISPFWLKFSNSFPMTTPGSSVYGEHPVWKLGPAGHLGESGQLQGFALFQNCSLCWLGLGTLSLSQAWSTDSLSREEVDCPWSTDLLLHPRLDSREPTVGLGQASPQQGRHRPPGWPWRTWSAPRCTEAPAAGPAAPRAAGNSPSDCTH